MKCLEPKHKIEIAYKNWVVPMEYSDPTPQDDFFTNEGFEAFCFGKAIFAHGIVESIQQNESLFFIPLIDGLCVWAVARMSRDTQQLSNRVASILLRDILLKKDWSDNES